MKSSNYLFTFLVFVFGFILIGAGCGGNQQSPNATTSPKQNGDSKQTYSLEESKQIATDWVKQESPTYKFDGSKLELTDSTETGGEDCKDCYRFTFEFESSHGGYGNREGKMITQVITPHEMIVDVEHGEVVEAITDGKYDEMGEKMLQSSGNNNTSSTHSDISVDNISNGDTINRVTTITGEAKGPWYFEGDFPVIAKDTSGQTIEAFIATAQGNWMTSNFVDFEVDIDLSNYSGNTVVLEFQKDNPSGQPQHDDSYSIQVNLN